MVDATTAAQNWVRAMGTAGDNYRRGIEAATKNPMEAAARQSEKWIANLQLAHQEGRWIRGLRRVTFEEWKSKCLTKGVARLAQGATEARPKVEAFMQEFIPFLAANVAVVQAMPSGTYEERKARAVQMMDLNHKFRQRNTGRAR